MARAKKVEVPNEGVVNILGSDWKVVLRPFPVDEQGNPSETDGYCDRHTHTIHINALMPAQAHADTLRHEIEHAMEYMLGIETDETRTRAMSTAWQTFNKANPALALWLVVS